LCFVSLDQVIASFFKLPHHTAYEVVAHLALQLSETLPGERKDPLDDETLALFAAHTHESLGDVLRNKILAHVTGHDRAVLLICDALGLAEQACLQ